MSRFTRRDISPCGDVILRPCRSDIRLLSKTSYGKAVGVRVSRIFSCTAGKPSAMLANSNNQGRCYKNDSHAEHNVFRSIYLWDSFLWERTSHVSNLIARISLLQVFHEPWPHGSIIIHLTLCHRCSHHAILGAIHSRDLSLAFDKVMALAHGSLSFRTRVGVPTAFCYSIFKEHEGKVITPSLLYSTLFFDLATEKIWDLQFIYFWKRI